MLHQGFYTFDLTLQLVEPGAPLLHLPSRLVIPSRSTVLIRMEVFLGHHPGCHTGGHAITDITGIDKLLQRGPGTGKHTRERTYTGAGTTSHHRGLSPHYSPHAYRNGCSTPSPRYSG